MEMICEIAPSRAKALGARIKKVGFPRDYTGIPVSVEAKADHGESGSVRVSYAVPDESNSSCRSGVLRKAIAVQESLPAESVSVEGKADVLSVGLAKACGKAKGNGIGLERQAEDFAFRNGKAVIKLPTAERSAPIPTDALFAGTIEIGTDAFATALRAVEPFASKDSTRYYLNGVFLHLMTGKLRCVATCGHRLAVRGIPILNPEARFWPDAGKTAALCNAEISTAIASDGESDRYASRSDQEDTGAFIMSSLHCRLLLDLIKDHKPERLEIRPPSSSGEWYRVDCETFSLYGKAIEGTFPLYGNVIPSGLAFRSECRAVLLHDAAKEGMAIASDAHDRGRVMAVALRDDEIRLRFRIPERAEFETTFPATLAARPTAPMEFECGFSAGYLPEVASAFGNCTAKDRKNHDAEPDLAILASEGKGIVVFQSLADPDSLIGVAPMRLN